MEPNDAEWTNAIGRIEFVYATEADPPRPMRDTPVDTLGYSWAGRYDRLRQGGMPHEQAIQQIEASIRSTPGFKPQPAPPDPGPTPPSAQCGPWTISGTGFLNGAGQPQTPLMCHWGEMLSAYIRIKQGVHIYNWTMDTWLAQLDALIAQGYRIFREWDWLGYYDGTGGWGGKEICSSPFTSQSGRQIPATPDYFRHYADYLLLLDARGCSIFCDRGDMNSISSQAKVDHHYDLGVMFSQLPQDVARRVLALLCSRNEGWQNGQPPHSDTQGNGHGGIDEAAFEQAERELLAFRDGAGWLPSAVGTTWNGTEERPDLQSWFRDPATVMVVHPMRDSSRIKGMYEHRFTNGYAVAHPAGIPGVTTEDTGPGPRVTVGGSDDPTTLVGLYTIGAVGGCSPGYMSSLGVFWDAPTIHQQPACAETAQMFARLNPTLMHWSQVFHSGSGNAGKRLVVADDAHDVESRFDTRMSADGEFVAVGYGINGAVPMVAERKFHAQVINPAKPLETEWEGDLQPGQRLPMSGVSRVVVGRLA